jgi:ubiquinone/menaquinone biosynthesis C-methylase UbiE
MIRKASLKLLPKENDLYQCEVYKTPFEDNKFDRILARMCFHHCVGRTEEAMDEMYRILRPGGLIVLCEGIPVGKKSFADFAKIVLSKENRLVFTEEDLKRLIHKFKYCGAMSVLLKQQSIRNWIENCTEDKELIKHVIALHRYASEDYKKQSNMIINKDGDILVDMKFHIVRGRK